MTEELDAIDRAGSHAQQALSALFGETEATTVFSAPHMVGDEMVITASAWERGGGFGFGAGSGSDEQGNGGSGGGGGGGGASQGRPVAVIRVGPGTVEVKPVIDLTKVGITVLLGLFGVVRALRR